MINVSYTIGAIFNINNKGSKYVCEFRTIQKEKNKKIIVSHWKTNFVGECVNKCKTLKDGDKITITSGVISNYYDIENNKNIPLLCVRDFDYGNTLKEHLKITPFS